MNINNQLYSKKFLNAIRIISSIAAIILILSTINVIIYGNEYNNPKEIFSNQVGTIIVNLFCLLCSTLLIIFPKKFSLISLMSFLYAFLIFLDEPLNLMGPLMALLSYFTLDARYFFRKNRIPKTILFIAILGCALLSEIRFGFYVFFNSLFNIISTIFVISLSLFFIKTKISIDVVSNLQPKILVLSTFPNTNERDVELLKYVLQNKQYKEIAQLTFRTEDTIRNRLNKIYDILQVGDRIGFLTIYTGYEITF